MFEDKAKMPGTQWNFYELGLGPGLSSPQDPMTWKRGVWSRVPSKTSSPHALPAPFCSDLPLGQVWRLLREPMSSFIYSTHTY